MYMGGLGVSFGDLPNGGHNLRLYTYDPPGSAYYNPSGFLYNTGHYDVSIPSGACGQSDAQGFNDWGSLTQYAGARGESLVLVSRGDLTALCNYRPPVSTSIPTPAPAPPFAPPPLNPTDSGSISVVLRSGSPAQPSLPPPTAGVLSPSYPIDTSQPQPIIMPSGSDNLTGVYIAAGLVLLFAARGVFK